MRTPADYDRTEYETLRPMESAVIWSVILCLCAVDVTAFLYIIHALTRSVSVTVWGSRVRRRVRRARRTLHALREKRA